MFINGKHFGFAGDKLARALELSTQLSLHKSMEGAIKLVNAMRLPALAERLNLLLEVNTLFISVQEVLIRFSNLPYPSVPLCRLKHLLVCRSLRASS